MRVNKLQVLIVAGENKEIITNEELKKGDAFKQMKTATENIGSSVHSAVKYDLLGKISEGTKLTGKTAAEILTKIQPGVFGQFKENPEDFIAKAITLINEQKATMIVEHLTYDPIEEKYDASIFTQDKTKRNLGGEPLRKHIYFVAETKGSMSTMTLREIEKSKIACAGRFFEKITSDRIKYAVVDSYNELMQIVK